ncbi:MAG: hypothetical protein OEV60_07100 [Actinomycetota bacterium]|nr:hypothetical protein [Actinomycetota bacterium]MDH5225128.1 hypothetical protein [Actinomycetota bacterium]MDH5314252.1 hypothetical protein [Actinomycetota bacterium]
MRKAIGLLLTALMCVLALGVANAGPQTNGSGLTHEGASLGFNAKANLMGNITYTSHDATMWQVMCRDDLTSYRNLRPAPSGALRTKVTADCKDKEGVVIYVEIYFIDRGEPGDRDVERVFFTYDATYRLDANSDPDVWLMTCNSGVAPTVACNDSGVITAGNVQIHQGDSLSKARQRTIVIGEIA